MSTYFPEYDTADDLEPSSGTQPAEIPRLAKCEELPLPPFNKWDTKVVIEAKLKKAPQLLAKSLADKTKRSGKIKISLPELARETGYDRKTLGHIMEEIVESGLLTRKRTREGYVYTWTRLAYNVADVGPRSDMSEYQNIASSEATDLAALRRDVVGGYTWAWRRHYDIPDDIKIARDAATISDAQLLEMRPHLSDLVTRLPPRDDIELSPVERASRRFFSQWCRRNGKNDCLKNARHPLWRLSKQDIFEDFATVFAKLAKEQAQRNPVEEKTVASRRAPAREMIAPAQGDVNFSEFIAQQAKAPTGSRRRAA